MEAILSAIRTGKIRNVNPAVVISDKEDAEGIRVAAENFRVPTRIISDVNSKGWKYDQKVLWALERYDICPEGSLICLAGFMRILSPEFIVRYPMRIINIHPALLPSFPGLHAQKQAIDYGVKISGCTVHFVDEGIDTGPIILQKAVPVFDSDTEKTLAARILKQEHILYPQAVRLISEHRVNIEGRKLTIKN